MILFFIFINIPPAPRIQSIWCKPGKLKICDIRWFDILNLNYSLEPQTLANNSKHDFKTRIKTRLGSTRHQLASSTLLRYFLPKKSLFPNSEYKKKEGEWKTIFQENINGPNTKKIPFFQVKNITSCATEFL